MADLEQILLQDLQLGPLFRPGCFMHEVTPGQPKWVSWLRYLALMKWSEKTAMQFSDFTVSQNETLIYKFWECKEPKDFANYIIDEFALPNKAKLEAFCSPRALSQSPSHYCAYSVFLQGVLSQSRDPYARVTHVSDWSCTTKEIEPNINIVLRAPIFHSFYVAFNDCHELDYRNGWNFMSKLTESHLTVGKVEDRLEADTYPVLLEAIGVPDPFRTASLDSFAEIEFDLGTVTVAGFGTFKKKRFDVPSRSPSSSRPGFFIPNGAIWDDSREGVHKEVLLVAESKDDRMALFQGIAVCRELFLHGDRLRDHPRLLISLNMEGFSLFGISHTIAECREDTYVELLFHMSSCTPGWDDVPFGELGCTFRRIRDFLDVCSRPVYPDLVREDCRSDIFPFSMLDEKQARIGFLSGPCTKKVRFHSAHRCSLVDEQGKLLSTMFARVWVPGHRALSYSVHAHRLAARHGIAPRILVSGAPFPSVVVAVDKLDDKYRELSSVNTLSEDAAIKLGSDLQELGILHGDLHRTNIFICEDGNVMLIDFEKSEILSDHTSKLFKNQTELLVQMSSK